jgi:hypothetical protein
MLRRQFFTSLAAGGFLSLSGCSEGGDSSSPTANESDDGGDGREGGNETVDRTGGIEGADTAEEAVQATMRKYVEYIDAGNYTAANQLQAEGALMDPWTEYDIEPYAEGSATISSEMDIEVEDDSAVVEYNSEVVLHGESYEPRFRYHYQYIDGEWKIWGSSIVEEETSTGSS